MKNTPLSAHIENHDELVIRVGIDVLAYAEEDREPFTTYDEKINDFRKVWSVTDPLEFAKDVLHELLDESEDGSSLLTNVLDMASKNALDQGSLGVTENKLDSIEN